MATKPEGVLELDTDKTGKGKRKRRDDFKKNKNKIKKDPTVFHKSQTQVAESD